MKKSLTHFHPKEFRTLNLGGERVYKLVKENYGKISEKIAKKILLDQKGIYDTDSMTIDSFVAVCEERTLSVRREGSNSNQWKTYSL